MRVTVNSHALPIYKKNRIASLLCIFETTILDNIAGGSRILQVQEPLVLWF